MTGGSVRDSAGVRRVRFIAGRLSGGSARLISRSSSRCAAAAAFCARSSSAPTASSESVWARRRYARTERIWRHLEAAIRICHQQCVGLGHHRQDAGGPALLQVELRCEQHAGHAVECADVAAAHPGEDGLRIVERCHLVAAQGLGQVGGGGRAVVLPVARRQVGRERRSDRDVGRGAATRVGVPRHAVAVGRVDRGRVGRGAIGRCRRRGSDAEGVAGADRQVRRRACERVGTDAAGRERGDRAARRRRTGGDGPGADPSWGRRQWVAEGHAMSRDRPDVGDGDVEADGAAGT